jgi:shikimate dehydrogenase
MKRACVIGWPVEHSRSPLIHGYWLKKYGIGGAYTKELVKPEDLEKFLASLTANGFAGCNVTVPHKEAAFAAADIKDTSALAVGAANTIWFEDGKLACANTDTYGFMTHLTTAAPHWKLAKGPIMILGAGGAARAIVHGFLEADCNDIRVFNRSLNRAKSVEDYFGRSVKAYDWDMRNQHVAAAAVIVNTTTLGMKDAGSQGIEFDCARKDCVVADIVYVPLETRFLKEARVFGLTAVDGLGMLLHQAVPGFEKWFGVRPEVTAELRRILVADIEGR